MRAGWRLRDASGRRRRRRPDGRGPGARPLRSGRQRACSGDVAQGSVGGSEPPRAVPLVGRLRPRGPSLASRRATGASARSSPSSAPAWASIPRLPLTRSRPTTRPIRGMPSESARTLASATTITRARSRAEPRRLSPCFVATARPPGWPPTSTRSRRWCSRCSATFRPDEVERQAPGLRCEPALSKRPRSGHDDATSR